MSQRQDGPFASSVQWQTLNVGVQILIQLGFIRVLGEYLTEVEWGLLGLVLSCAGLVEIFAQLGVGPSLIQRQDLSRQQVSAAFWFSMLLGLGFALGFAFGAPTVAGWFHRPDMEPVLEWAALSFLLAAFALVPRSLLIRRMDFRSLFWSSLVAMLLANAVFGIWAATAGWGVYAYIGALLLQNGLLGLQYWWRSGLRIDWRPHLSAARGLLRYGASSTVFNFLNYAATKLDLLVLGRLLPEARSPEQGLYDRSVYLMNTPVTVLGKLSDSVLFSGMSQVQDERERLQRIFYGGTYIVTLLVLVLVTEILDTIKGANDNSEDGHISSSEEAAATAADAKLALAQVLTGFASILTLLLSARDYDANCVINVMYIEDIDGYHSLTFLKPKKYWHLSFLFFFRATMGNVALITAGLALKNVELKVNAACAAADD